MEKAAGARAPGLRPPQGRAISPRSRSRAERWPPSRRCSGDRPRERALLIEYLHLIQDQEGCLPEGHLHALAEELRIPMAEVYEVATFYAHFDVVAERRGSARRRSRCACATA